VFARYHATLFAKQDSLGLLSWADIAGIAGVSDTQSFKECVDTGGGIARVADDLATAHSLELDRTPSVFLDGLRFARRPSLAALDTLVGATAKAQRD
jgi:protein-disulfide isomerase